MTKTKFGFCLPIFAGASAWDYSIDFASMKSSIASCEQLGFDSLWVPDHLTMGYHNEILECWTVLAAASQLSEHLRLGTLVLNINHRSPSILAKMAATLDVISNGRLELGLGAGWRGSELLSYGMPWNPSTKPRVERLIEAVKIIRGMWANKQFSYSGQYYSVTNATCRPAPLQKPHPRIWLGGSGERVVLKAVAEFADGWNVGEISPEEFAGKLQVLRSHCQDAGTDFDRIEKSLETIVLISDKAEELQRVVSWSNWFAGIQSETKEMKPARGDLSNMKNQYVLGSVREVTDRIADYIHVGVQHFMLYFLDYPRKNSMTAFTKDVIPSV